MFMAGIKFGLIELIISAGSISEPYSRQRSTLFYWHQRYSFEEFERLSGTSKWLLDLVRPTDYFDSYERFAAASK